MVKISFAKPKKTRVPGTVLQMTGDEARSFFLKADSYCTIDLPHYFRFGPLLADVSDILSTTPLSDCKDQEPRDFDDVNHSLYNNKDGKYAWRPLQLIHPAIYVSLVHAMTEPQNWTTIQRALRRVPGRKEGFQCLSIPLQSESAESNKAVQVSAWWQRVEQASIELSLEYDYTVHTDVVDCYGAIYTHSLSWALHTKQIAKEPKNRRDKSLIGNVIDSNIQDMRNGQTNGIPQGSVLMDFISEMVLGYADLEISSKLANSAIGDYRILRYRDDYRVFTNSSQEGERILKCIAEVMIDLGLKLGAAKTKVSDSVVVSSIKEDKLSWLCRKQTAKSLQKQLLIIHDHSIGHPNSGSLRVALGSFHKRVVNMKRINDALPIIGILVDIAFHNPRTYPVAAAILSKLLQALPSDTARSLVVDKIKRKFDKLPNTGHMQLWLQRISIPVGGAVSYDEPLLQTCGWRELSKIWNSDWITSTKTGRGALRCRNHRS